MFCQQRNTKGDINDHPYKYTTMESEDISGNQASICIHCCRPVCPSNDNKDDNNRFQHSSPSLSTSNYYVTNKALSSIFKLNYLNPFDDTFEWPQEDEEAEKLTLLCVSCSDVLADLYHLYQNFLHLGQIDSVLSQKLDRLDEIIACHERKSIKCDLITINRSEPLPQQEETSHSSPLSKATDLAKANLQIFPKELRILLTRLSERELTTTTTIITTAAMKEEGEEEFNDNSSSSAGDYDDDEHYNPDWLDDKMEEGEDKLTTSGIKVKTSKKIVESKDDDGKPLNPLAEIGCQQYGRTRRKRNANFSVSISKSSTSSSSSTLNKKISTNQSKSNKETKKNKNSLRNKMKKKNIKDHLDEKDIPKYFVLKAKFPNPCWYCQRTDFETPSELFAHTMEEHFPKMDRRNKKILSSIQVCKRCSRILTCKSRIDQHLHWCQSIPSGNVYIGFRCKFCSRGFAQNATLKKHLATHSDERPFSCDRCIFTTKFSGCLRKHKVAIHSNGNERFQCDECGKYYKDQNVLSDHKSSMHRPAEGYNDMIEATVRREKAKVSVITPTFCVDCDVDMFSRLALSNHRRTVHGDMMGREIICDVCGKYVRDRCQLADHMKTTHSDSRPFICETCGKSFKTNSNLKDHVTRTHTEDGRQRYNEITRERIRRRKLIASQLASKTGDGGGDQMGQIGGESSSSSNL